MVIGTYNNMTPVKYGVMHSGNLHTDLPSAKYKTLKNYRVYSMHSKCGCPQKPA